MSARPETAGSRAPAILAAIVALATAAAPLTSRAEAALNAEQIRTLITNNTFNGAWFAKQLTIAFHDDGTLVGTLGLSGSDVGKWKLDGDLYCQQWVRYFQAEPRCYRWVPAGDGYLLENADSYRTHDISGRMSPGIPSGY